MRVPARRNWRADARSVKDMSMYDYVLLGDGVFGGGGVACAYHMYPKNAVCAWIRSIRAWIVFVSVAFDSGCVEEDCPMHTRYCVKVSLVNGGGGGRSSPLKHMWSLW